MARVVLIPKVEEERLERAMAVLEEMVQLLRIHGVAMVEAAVGLSQTEEVLARVEPVVTVDAEQEAVAVEQS